MLATVHFLKAVQYVLCYYQITVTAVLQCSLNRTIITKSTSHKQVISSV